MTRWAIHASAAPPGTLHGGTHAWHQTRAPAGCTAFGIESALLAVPPRRMGHGQGRCTGEMIMSKYIGGRERKGQGRQREGQAPMPPQCFLTGDQAPMYHVCAHRTVVLHHTPRAAPHTSCCTTHLVLHHTPRAAPHTSCCPVICSLPSSRVKIRHTSACTHTHS